MNSDILARKIKKYESRLLNSNSNKHSIYLNKIQHYRAQTGGDGSLALSAKALIDEITEKKNEAKSGEYDPARAIEINTAAQSIKSKIDGIIKSLDDAKGLLLGLTGAVKTDELEKQLAAALETIKALETSIGVQAGGSYQFGASRSNFIAELLQ